MKLYYNNRYTEPCAIQSKSFACDFPTTSPPSPLRRTETVFDGILWPAVEVYDGPSPAYRSDRLLKSNVCDHSRGETVRTKKNKTKNDPVSASIGQSQGPVITHVPESMWFFARRVVSAIFFSSRVMTRCFSWLKTIFSSFISAVCYCRRRRRFEMFFVLAITRAQRPGGKRLSHPLAVFRRFGRVYLRKSIVSGQQFSARIVLDTRIKSTVHAARQRFRVYNLYICIYKKKKKTICANTRVYTLYIYTWFT